VKTKILQILKLAGASGLPETALRMEIEMRFRITVGDMEFTHALAELVRLDFIRTATDDLTGDKHWTINDK
jgi:hypothetical protein